MRHMQVYQISLCSRCTSWIAGQQTVIESQQREKRSAACNLYVLDSRTTESNYEPAKGEV